jgi:hydrogenase nickel incorporation protein HypA/HybF
MHEMSLCESILQILQDEARAKGFQRVREVCLEIGELASVEPEALRFGFDVVMRGSLADGARLRIEPVAGAAWCMACSNRVALPRRGDPCPRCGSHQLQVLAGDAMRIKELEVN